VDRYVTDTRERVGAVQIARECGISIDEASTVYHMARRRRKLATERDPEPTAEPIRELLSRREDVHDRARMREPGVVYVDMPDDRPFGLALVGDPHIDDDGTDVRALRRDLRVCAHNPRMRPICVGDLTNNWVGRLERLWAHQTTDDDEALRLLTWLMGACKWDCIVLGNHDQWNKGAKLLPLLAPGVPLRPDKAQIEYHAPGCEPVRVEVRHTFRGGSQYSATHGQIREALMGGRWAEAYVAGHRHTAEMRHQPTPDRMWRMLVQVGSYKRMDAYARELGYPSQHYGESCTIIVDPRLPAGHPERMAHMWGVERAAGFVA
jgi:hypothetical protein